MTQNQIAYQQMLESKRSNQARETETNRANVVKEKETRAQNAKRNTIDIFGSLLGFFNPFKR